MLFGDVPISSESLATMLCRNVRAGVNAFPQNPSIGIWTAIVKDVLYREGARRNFEVWCSGIKDCQESLLDMVWWQRNREGIALAVECEWDCRDLLRDFQKLLCTKAPLKLFIYDGGDVPDSGDKECEQIKSLTLAYRHHVEGETYLFVSFGNTGQYSYRFIVPKDGALHDVEFEPLSDVPTAPYAAVP